jgi:hypothetical protein
MYSRRIRRVLAGGGLGVVLVAGLLPLVAVVAPAGAAQTPRAGYVATDLGVSARTATLEISPGGRYVVAQVSPNTATLPTTELIDTTTMTSTPMPPNPGSGTVAAPDAIHPRGVNDSGVVAGWTYESFPNVGFAVQTAVLWTAAGGVDEIGAAQGALGNSTEFDSISDGSPGCTGICGTAAAGYLVSVNGGPLEPTGCLLDSSPPTDLQCFNTNGPEHTDAINAGGTMITNVLDAVPGPVAATYQQVAEWSGSNLPAIPTGLTGYQTENTGGSTTNSFRWLNDAGDLIVAHNGQTTTVSGAALYTASNQAIQAITAPGISGTQLIPWAVNKDDAVVGGYNNANGAGNTAFVWTPTGGLLDLAPLVLEVTNEPVTPARLIGAVGLGDNGNIVAFGTPEQGCPATISNCLDAYLLKPSLAPYVTAVNPPSGPTSGPMDGGNVVNVTGGNFGPAGTADTVQFCTPFGTPVDPTCVSGSGVSVSDDEHLTVTAPSMTLTFITLLLTVGSHGSSLTASTLLTDIVVTNPTTGASIPPGPGPAPTDRYLFSSVYVSSVSPSSGPVTPVSMFGFGQQITVTGSGFEQNGTSDVAWVEFCWSTPTSPDTSQCTPSGHNTLFGSNLNVQTDSVLTVDTPDALADLAPGQSTLVTDVVVVTQANESSVIDPPDDTYIFGPVTVTDLSPRSGNMSGGEPVVIKGTGFGVPGQADQVNFVPEGGGAPIPAASATVVSDTEIDAVTPDVTSEVGSEGTRILPDYNPSAFDLYTDVQVTTPTQESSAITPDTKFTFPLTIVQLGDSISSGEGTLYGYSYDPNVGTWYGGDISHAPWEGPYPGCHDSHFSYGNLVADSLGANFINFGCTGGTYLNGIMGDSPYRPAEFRGNADYDTAAPDVVLATFGADDVQFVDIVTACIASSVENNGSTLAQAGGVASGNFLLTALGASAQQFAGPLQCVPGNRGPTVVNDFDTELPTLQNYYGNLVTAIEARGEAASPPKVPKIVFTNYMNPFPSSGTCPDTMPMTAAQVQFLSGLLGQLNAMIQTTVTAIAANDPNVSFVDISHALDGHTWCSTDPWDYGMTALLAGNSAQSLADVEYSKAPFHPTPAGQSAIADLVRPAVHDAISSGHGLLAFISSALSNAVGTPDGVTAGAGGLVSGAGGGFLSGEPVNVTLHSTPVLVGSFTADQNGNVQFTVTIPPDTPSGDHELVLTGATSGRVADLPVTVPPTDTAPFFLLSVPPLSTPAASPYAYGFLAVGAPQPSYSLAAGAPSWLSIDPLLGSVAGTPPAGTTSFTYTVTATNGIAPDASAGPFTVTVQSPPAFSSARPPLTATTGTSYSYGFAAGGSPAPTYGLASGAPSWLSIDPATGLLSGTPPSGMTSFTYSVTATNGISPDASAGPFTVQVSTPVSGPDLAVSIVHGGRFRPGDHSNYLIEVTSSTLFANHATATLTDHLPSGLTFEAGKGSGWHCAAVGPNVTCTYSGPVILGLTSPLTVFVYISASPGTVITNSVTVTPTDATPTDNTATDRTTVRPPTG